MGGLEPGRGRGGVWAIPQDAGPLGNLYPSDILEQAGITEPPATWDEYAGRRER